MQSCHWMEASGETLHAFRCFWSLPCRQLFPLAFDPKPGKSGLISTWGYPGSKTLVFWCLGFDVIFELDFLRSSPATPAWPSTSGVSRILRPLYALDVFLKGLRCGEDVPLPSPQQQIFKPSLHSQEVNHTPLHSAWYRTHLCLCFAGASCLLSSYDYFEPLQP